MNYGFASRLFHAYKTHLGTNVSSIILFGSRAICDYKKLNYFDILTIAASLPVRHLARIGNFRAQLSNFEEKISIILIDKDRFMDSTLNKNHWQFSQTPSF